MTMSQQQRQGQKRRSGRTKHGHILTPDTYTPTDTPSHPKDNIKREPIRISRKWIVVIHQLISRHRAQNGIITARGKEPKIRVGDLNSKQPEDTSEFSSVDFKRSNKRGQPSPSANIQNHLEPVCPFWMGRLLE